jgi:predicted nicotinamide N-methyase
MSRDLTAEAFKHFRDGRDPESAQICLDILASNPDNAEINQLLGVIRTHDGKFADAITLLQRAIAAPNATAEMHNNLGTVLYQLGQPQEAIAAFNRAIKLDPDYADALNNLGVVYRDTKKTAAAIEAFRKAVELRPDMIHAKANLRAAYRDVVPPWHFAMMNDKPRNTAYDAAIRRAVSGKRVLEIGTGAGLLAMMAARAGAKNITTCDRVRLIADRAREIVAQNGLAERVKVIAKGSDELVLGEDLSERAEVLVTEIFGNNLVDEGVLPTLEHAHQHLLTEDAVVVPAGGSVVGYLAGGDTLKDLMFVDSIEGFDLSSFNDFAPPMLSVSSSHFQHDVMSNDTELLRFDFREKSFPAQAVADWLVATKPGICIGVVQWIKIDLDSETHYENRPRSGDNKTHWGYKVHRFPQPIQVQPGDQVPIVVRHDRRHVYIDLAE